METEAEVAMICVGNIRMFEEQVDAMRVYCTQKINANPKNVVGIVSMSGNLGRGRFAVEPTRDISAVMAAVNSLPINGPSILLHAISLAANIWCNDSTEDLKKRIVVFAEGDIYDYYWCSRERAVFEALLAASRILNVKEDRSEAFLRSSRLSHLKNKEHPFKGKFPIVSTDDLVDEVHEYLWENYDRIYGAREIAQAETPC